MSDETQTNGTEEQNQQLVFNGINAKTGDYLTPRLTVDELAGLAQHKSLEEIRQGDSDNTDSRIQELSAPKLKQLIRTIVLGSQSGQMSLDDLFAQIDQDEFMENAALQEFAGRLVSKTGAAFPLIAGKDPNDLRQTGWGVIFAQKIDPRVREALQPLLDFRRRQVLENNDADNRHELYQDFTYRGEDAMEFLDYYGAGPGVVDPDRGVPYYLLLVGDPEQIPYEFQYQLDIQFGVGRIWFDTIEEYRQYALNVIYAESGAFALPRTAVFFGVSNDDDQATQLSAEYLVKPLAAKMQQSIAQDQENLKQGKITREQAFPPWDIRTLIGKEATRQNLITLLKMKSPALLFTASHGLGFEKDDPEQLDYQGALLCQEWPGPFVGTGPIPKEHYFSADDVSDDMVLTGTIAFFFACYGAGTPEYDEFSYEKGERPTIAPRPFLARLPRKLLSHPRGGALAVIGHVERAWGYSFYWGHTGEQTQTFEDAFRNIMPLQGKRLGFAYEQFNIRYAQLATELSAKLEQMHRATPRRPGPTNAELASTWTASNDARGYVIIGDPAVKLPVGDGAAVQGKREIDAAALQTILQETAAFLQQEGVATSADSVSTSVPEVSAAAEPPPRPVAPADASARDFGLFGQGRQDKDEEEQELEQTRSGLRDTITEVAEKLGESLKQAIDNATTLHVTTYVSRDLSQVRSQGGGFVGGDVQLRALTEIGLDGDTRLVLPQNEDGEIDREIWEIHSDMVKRAQDSRNDLIKTMSSAVAGLIESLKVL